MTDKMTGQRETPLTDAFEEAQKDCGFLNTKYGAALIHARGLEDMIAELRERLAAANERDAQRALQIADIVTKLQNAPRADDES